MILLSFIYIYICACVYLIVQIWACGKDGSMGVIHTRDEEHVCNYFDIAGSLISFFFLDWS